ncbi:MAG: hypothetical protein J2P27_15795 [Actinobacteria bacterium]|nr:hypothetical protein [Actinomycetota bacterium]
MRLRSHRRNLVVWSSSVDPAGWYRAETFIRFGRTGWIYRWTRTGALLAVIGLMRLARAVGHHWRPVLSLVGGGLAVAGLMLPSGVFFVPGMLVLLVALLIPADSSTRFVYCIGGPAQLVRNATVGYHAQRTGQRRVR